jgi:hypothetical protein
LAAQVDSVLLWLLVLQRDALRGMPYRLQTEISLQRRHDRFCGACVEFSADAPGRQSGIGDCDLGGGIAVDLGQRIFKGNVVQVDGMALRKSLVATDESSTGYYGRMFMKRMIMAAGMIALVAIISPQAPAAEIGAPGDRLEGKDFAASPLLSPENDLDLQALKLLSEPTVMDERRRGEKALRDSLPNASPSSLARFKSATEEIAFFGLLNGLNDDPTHPRITIVGRPGRMVDGKYTLAPKGLDENPDSVYRIIPVDGTSTYVLRGRVSKDRAQINEFSVLDDAWLTVGNLAREDLKIGADGSFAIVVGPQPMPDIANFIQTKPGANYMTIRDTIADWPRQRPNALTVERVAGPPAMPQSDAAQLQRAIAKVKRYFSETLKLHNLALKQPANFFPQPVIRTTFGMLVTQAYSIGRFDLKEDEALVLTLHPGTAKYMTVPVTDIWGTTGDPIHQQSSLNILQATANPDKTFTFVVSRKDPLVQNWVDTEGLSEGFIFLRWAAIEGGKDAEKSLGVESRVVPLAELSGVVPSTLKRIDAAERRREIAQRTRDYDLRWLGPEMPSQ